jgi:endonuclease YncB( thermonuclease family)
MEITALSGSDFDGIQQVGGIDANLEQVKAGMAWHYKAYEKEQRPEDRLSA